MLKKRPEDLTQVELKVNHATDIINNENNLQERLINCFNQYGFAIITPNEVGDNLISLKPLFGTITEHEKMNSEGILVIDPHIGHSVGQKNTEKEHMLHTDEVYLSEPCKIMILQCVVPSLSGGESTIVYGSEMLNYCKENFNNHEIRALFESDCLNCGRALPGSSKFLSTDFAIFSENNRNLYEVKWRSFDSYVNFISKNATRIYHSLNSFVCNKENQLKLKLNEGQILILDNRSLLHGRNSFPKTERRILWRTNYKNDGILSSRLINGFSH